MINYLAAEFNQLLKKKNFFICLAAVVLASLANIIVVLIGNPDYISMSPGRLQQVMLRFASNKFVAIIIVFVTTVFITGINGSNIKNAITIGYSRTQIYFSKIILGGVVLMILLFSSMVATFLFTGIWLPSLLTIEACWEALIRFALVALLYLTQLIIAITICYIINSNMLFAIVYFALFLVFTEIVSSLASYNKALEIFANITITHQLDHLVFSDSKLLLWPYIVSCSIVYSLSSILLGLLVINKKDIR